MQDPGGVQAVSGLTVAQAAETILNISVLIGML